MRTPARRALLLFGAAALLAVGLPGRANAATEVAVPSAIDATGASDVSVALDAFFASIPAGATVSFPADARYRVEGVVRIRNAQDVTLEGNGAEIFAETNGQDVPAPGGRFRARWPRLREHVSILNATNLTIRDLSIRGPNDEGRYVPALEGQAGIAIYRSNNVIIDDVSVRATHGDGVYIAGASADITVRNSSFQSIGRQGIAPVFASNVLIERNSLDGIARSVFDIEPAVPRWKVDSVRMQDNVVGAYTNFLLAAGGAGAEVTDLWLERTRVTGGNGLAVFAGMPRWLRSGLHIVDNRSEVPGRHVAGEQRDGVMQIARIAGVEIRGNVMSVEGGPAITLSGVCDADVRDNEFPGASATVVESGVCDRTAAQPPPGSSRPRATTGAQAARPDEETEGAARPAARRGVEEGPDRDWLVAVGLGVLAVLAFFAVRWRRNRRAGAS